MEKCGKLFQNYSQIPTLSEPQHDKTNKMACAPGEDSGQPGHPPTLISVFAVCMKKPWVISFLLSGQQRLLSDWADVQADLSLRWAHSHFVGFVVLWLICFSVMLHATSRENLSLGVRDQVKHKLAHAATEDS